MDEDSDTRDLPWNKKADLVNEANRTLELWLHGEFPGLRVFVQDRSCDTMDLDTPPEAETFVDEVAEEIWVIAKETI